MLTVVTMPASLDATNTVWAGGAFSFDPCDSVDFWRDGTVVNVTKDVVDFTGPDDENDGNLVY